MQIDVNSFLVSPAAKSSYTAEFSFADIAFSGGRSILVSVRVDATLSGGYGSATLDTFVSYAFQLPCDRCLEPFFYADELNFTHILVKNIEESNKDDDRFVEVPKGILELEELIRADVILSFPVKFLCQENCAGLCPQCGANLNRNTCSCKREEIDPRLAVLQALLDSDET